MRVLCWHGKGDVRIDTVPDPKIQDPRDAIIEITACAICGSDHHRHDDGRRQDVHDEIVMFEVMRETLDAEWRRNRGFGWSGSSGRMKL